MIGKNVRLREDVARSLLGDPDTQGLVLITILLWAFGDEMVMEQGAQDPALLWAATFDRFGTWIPEEGENKVNAMITALLSDNFYHDPETFVAVCMSLASGDLGDLADGIMEDLESYEATWGCIEVMLARADDEPMEMSRSVKQIFDEATARASGDSVLREVTAEISDMQQRLLALGVTEQAISALPM